MKMNPTSKKRLYYTLKYKNYVSHYQKCRVQVHLFGNNAFNAVLKKTNDFLLGLTQFHCGLSMSYSLLNIGYKL